MNEIIIPGEQIDSKKYFYPSGDEIIDTRRKIGVWLKWHHFGGVFGGLVDVLSGEKRDAHDRLVDFIFDNNNNVYKVIVN